jgi:plastocyanin
MATATPTATPTAATSRGRAVLPALIYIGLLGAALLFGPFVVISLLKTGNAPPPPAIFTAVDLIGAGVLATRWRWAPTLSLLIGALSLVLDLSPGFPQYQLTHPSAFSSFAPFVLHVALNLLVVIASVGALIQAARKETPHAPRWISAAVTGVVCLTLGALLVGGTAHYSAGSAGATQAGTEVVHLTADTFAPDIIALHKGDTLTVIDDVSVPHVLANGTWSASGQAQPGAESGAPTINNVQINNNTVVLGPFTSPGTYHILCLVHPGMNLTVIVQ